MNTYTRERHSRQDIERPKKVVIYTAICGNYDTLREPLCIDSRFEYVCFTDQTFDNSGIWEIRPFVRHFRNPILTNRYHKMHPHLLFPEHEFSVYIDGNIQIAGTHIYSRTLQLIQSRYSLSMVRHPYRDCVYNEIEACQTKDSTVRLWKHHSFLKKNKYPQNNSLFEANVIFRQHHLDIIIEIMAEWWKLLNKYSRRDQLSLPYILWKRNIKPEPFFLNNGENVRNHRGYTYYDHKTIKKNNNLFQRIISSFVPVNAWRKKIRNFRF